MDAHCTLTSTNYYQSVDSTSNIVPTLTSLYLNPHLLLLHLLINHLVPQPHLPSSHLSLPRHLFIIPDILHRTHLVNLSTCTLFVRCEYSTASGKPTREFIPSTPPHLRFRFYPPTYRPLAGPTISTRLERMNDSHELQLPHGSAIRYLVPTPPTLAELHHVTPMGITRNIKTVSVSTHPLCHFTTND